MVRARTNRVVMSQRDVRQTTQPDPSQPATANFRSSFFCTCCRANGRHYACLAESSYASCMDPDCVVPSDEWTNSSMNSEGWVPASGPCCEDCLEAAFERRRKAEGGSGGGGGRRGRDLMVGAGTWCVEQGERMQYTVLKGWNALLGWLGNARQRLTARDSRVQQSSLWSNVSFEAEGFVEVKMVITKEGVMQHMEIDFPSDIPIKRLQFELATVTHIPAEAQIWFYQGQQMDPSKTLDELNVDIGAVLEVKGQSQS